jgi:hypothetical protein
MNLLINKKKRILVIGDIHGCLKELKLCLDKVSFNPNSDQLVQLGDMIDRGPYSAETVKFLRSLPSTQVIVGNHDWKLIKHYKSLKKGNTAALKRERQIIYDALSKEDLDWLVNLPFKIYYPQLSLLFVHGGVLPFENPLTQDFSCYLFGRYVLKASGKHKSLTPPLYIQPLDTVHWTEIYNKKTNIIYGHHVHDLQNPHFVKNSLGWTLGLDTGCCFGGKMTMAVIDVKRPDSFEIVQVDSQQPFQDNPYKERR